MAKGKIPPALRKYLFKKGSHKAKRHGASGGRKSRPRSKG